MGGDRRSSDPHDSDSDSELDIEGPGSPEPDEMNTSGDRDRSREESGSEEDPLTKTPVSPVSGAGGLHYPGWPAHPAFSTLTGSAGPPGAPPGVPPSLGLNKITSQFWGFDPIRPPLPTPPAHPLDSLSPLSFPLSFSGLQSHFFKLPAQAAAESEARSQMFRFRSST